MQDEKLLEVSLEAMSSRVQELKESIQAFLVKLENEQMNWPSVLDNYALLSGQVNTLTKLLKNEKTPFFRNLVLLPLLVQQEADSDIQKATDGRIQAFNHEVAFIDHNCKYYEEFTEFCHLEDDHVTSKSKPREDVVGHAKKDAKCESHSAVPDYLRTKYDPEIEESEQRLETMATNIPAEQAQKQIATLNELASNLNDVIKFAREEWEGEQGAAARSSSTVNPDLNTLVAAVTFGKGLKPAKVTKGRSSKSDKGPQGAWSSDKSTNKVPSSMKLDTKAAANIHPYGTANRSNNRTGP